LTIHADRYIILIRSFKMRCLYHLNPVCFNALYIIWNGIGCQESFSVYIRRWRPFDVSNEWNV